MADATSEQKAAAMQQLLQEAAIRRQKAMAGLGGAPKPTDEDEPGRKVRDLS